jgi:hypothetical protein
MRWQLFYATAISPMHLGSYIPEEEDDIRGKKNTSGKIRKKFDRRTPRKELLGRLRLGL